MLIATIGTIILLPLLGYLGDKVSSTILVPTSFTLRGVTGYLFIWLSDPNSWFAKSICVLLIIFTVFEGISIEVLLMRGMPSQIRGSMLGVVGFSGKLGAIVFTLVGG